MKIGPEIVDEAIKVLNAAAKKCNFELNYKEYLMGGIAIDTTGVP
ncbi:isocitrate/isopropylmalate family dehydrogenase, partial [Arcobacter defluvii]